MTKKTTTDAIGLTTTIYKLPGQEHCHVSELDDGYRTKVFHFSSHYFEGYMTELIPMLITGIFKDFGLGAPKEAISKCKSALGEKGYCVRHPDEDFFVYGLGRKILEKSLNTKTIAISVGANFSEQVTKAKAESSL